jgi:hypothetical protein
MKIKDFFKLILIIVAICGCEKSTNFQDESSISNNDLIVLSEFHLQLKSGQTIYSDNSGNKYYTLNFNPDTLEHIYSVFLEKGKKYYITISGNQAYPVDMFLLTSSKDTLFYGETVDIPIMKKYIVWESNITDTMFVSLIYNEDINFHTYYYQLTFEELTIKRLIWDNLEFEYSGDWFINNDNYLTLVCHNSSYTKWVRIDDNSLNNFEFSYEVSLQSGIPDIYTGIAFYATDKMQEMFNMPIDCYEVKIIGPTSWEVWTWRYGGMGRYWGETQVSLNRGQGSWNNIFIKTSNDSVSLKVNNEQVNKFKNVHFMDNGLYITVTDNKVDTVYFKDIELTK